MSAAARIRRSNLKKSNLATKRVFPIHVTIYELAIKYYSIMKNLIKSNDKHNVMLKNAYLEDKQLYVENKKCWLSCIKSFQRLLNVNFDTECKMLGSRLEKFFADIFFLLNYNFSIIIFSVVSSHFTVHYLTLILRN